MGVVQDVVDRLVAQSIADASTGGATGWQAVRRNMHDAQDQLVVVTEDGGPTPDFPASSGVGSGAIEDAGVQVMVRAQEFDGDASESKATEVKQELHGTRDLTINGTRYIRIRAMTPDPVFAGFDDNGRPTHTIAFRLMRDHNQ